MIQKIRNLYDGIERQKIAKTWRAIARLVWAFAISNRPVVGLLPVQKAALNTDGQKMIAARVTESYTSLFLTSKHDDGSRHAAIARIGAFEVRLLEMPSANSPEEASLWVELYDRGLRVGVDSYKCGDLDEAIDVAQLLMNQATRLNSEAGEVALFAFGRSNEVIK
ncbi:MAG TPA: hypothetical protein VGI09_04830 [Pseudolabrys sp.]|jgi:hypothetical protein